ncbi:MAG: enoyl-CoA hydratase/isomerase family protein [Candidatus Aminicenantes bacterium]|nr:enoyl-CoA hydratase/isomerase family protein [Candidatus Aminicenantes bacterium]
MAVKNYTTIFIEREGRVGRIWFNRPEVHNAFNAIMIRELRDALADVRQDPQVRVVILSGRGTSFCAGADLNWLREIVHYSYNENLQESAELADCLEELYALPKPTIARVNGSAIGGGNGFLAACDIIIASREAVFGLSEAKLGLVPAVISPYIVRRIGEARARRYFLTGERIDAARAEEVGLINRSLDPGMLDAQIDDFVRMLLTSGPEALAKTKDLLRSIPRLSFEEAKRFSIEMIAKLRISAEAQEGMAAFLEKRKPKWAE